MTNCDRGLENAARGRRPREAFSSSKFIFSKLSNEKKTHGKKKLTLALL